MNKLPDHRARLFAVVAKYENKTFEYGSADCALFGADVVEAMTGIDPAADYRGHYKTALGGLRAIRKAGYNDQADWLRAHGVEVSPPMAQVGDLVVIATGEDGETGYSIGVCGGSFILAMGLRGLVRLPLAYASECWRIAD